MHQASATIWNQIAEMGPLATAWAEQMFPLPAAQLDRALEREEARLAAAVGDQVAAAYLKVMPLLWERAAISNYLREHPETAGALPPLETATEAVLMAERDFSLTIPQKKRLLALLRTEPR